MKKKYFMEEKKTGFGKKKKKVGKNVFLGKNLTQKKCDLAKLLFLFLVAMK